MRQNAVPSILTQPVTDASAWRGSDMQDSNTWIYEVGPEGAADLLAALRSVRARGLRQVDITKNDFVLPSLEADLARLLEELQYGRGFVLMRGLPLDDISDDDAGHLYWGLGMHLGTGCSQNARGDLLGHVRDEGHANFRHASDLRGYQTRARLGFHSDVVDLVGLLCLHPAKEGGLSSIVSSVTVHNELLANHREYLGLLYNDFSWDLRGEEPAGHGPTHRSPIYSYYGGYLSCRPPLLDYIYSGQQKTGIQLSAVEREALDLFASTAEREELRLTMDLRRGDLQILHDSVILHARTDYVDFEEPWRKRHLLRLWLKVADGRPLAPGTYEFYRDGVPVKPTAAAAAGRSLP